MSTNIPAPLLDQLRALASGLCATRLVLFGSRARGDHRPTSDIDLAVWGLDHVQTGRLRLALEDLPTLLRFDLVPIGPDTDPALLENIEKEGIVLYAAEM